MHRSRIQSIRRLVSSASSPRESAHPRPDPPLNDSVVDRDRCAAIYPLEAKRRRFHKSSTFGLRRVRKRAIRLRVPQLASEHHIRWPPLEWSRNSQPQLSPLHSRISRRSFRAISNSSEARAKARPTSSSSSNGNDQANWFLICKTAPLIAPPVRPSPRLSAQRADIPS
jgi:hypothetical protein